MWHTLGRGERVPTPERTAEIDAGLRLRLERAIRAAGWAGPIRWVDIVLQWCEEPDGTRRYMVMAKAESPDVVPCACGETHVLRPPPGIHLWWGPA